MGFGRVLTASVIILLSAIGSATAQVDGYFASPDIHGDTLIFASEGDLWRSDRSGGTATRITTHPEVESHPAISPDGQSLAFNANYDGPTEVYVMPLTGGRPKQVTFEGGGVQVQGWTPGGAVLFSSANEPGTRPRVLRSVDPVTLETETLPLLDATTGTFGDNEDTLFFTRFGLSLSNDNAALYRGGRMAQLWRFNGRDGREAIRLASDFNAPIRDIMWWNGRLYFVSDQSGSDNIWSMTDVGGDVQQVTDFEGWQIQSPSIADGTLVYQRGADLYAFDIASATETELSLQLDSDRDYARSRWLESPLRYMEAAHIGPDGASAVITARANVAVAFPRNTRRVELAIPEEARARNAVLGIDEAWVYVVLDQGLRGEIWRFPADGRGEPQPLTEDSDSHIWSLHPSPDGERIVYHDKLGRLWSLDIETRSKTLLETTESGFDEAFNGFSWSKGGRYIAYTVFDPSGMAQVALRDLQTGTRSLVSGSKYESSAPAFSSDGEWLYFLSDRNFVASPSGPWGDRVSGPAFDKRGNVYAVQLVEGAEFPFTQDNELATDDEDAAGEEGETENGEETSEDADAQITFAGLQERLWQVPVDSGNYSSLKANGEFLFVLSRDRQNTALQTIKIDDTNPDVKTLVQGNVAFFDLSADGSTLMYVQRNGILTAPVLVPAKPGLPDDLSDHRVRLRDWRLRVNPSAEWRQQFLDAWRLHRDFAYDPNLRGIDWDAVREKYLPLADRIGHRSELNDLLGQMAWELGILHSQIGSGDQPNDAETGAVASLGAVFKPTSNGLEIVQIYQAELDLIEQRGPLLKPGIDVQVGDTLTAVDGRIVASAAGLAAALTHKAGQEVRLDLTRGSQDISAIVTPVSRWPADRLRYQHWVELNRRAVAEASDGDIGYLHLRAMGGGDISSFVRDFYEHWDKDGIIIDVRGNRGGNVDSFVIGILLRQVWAFWEYPVGGAPTTNMQQTFRGHLTVLINEGTYSDGETFAAGVKALDLGTLIGTRTAGAGIWLSDRNRLSDRGIARIAEFAQSGLDGRWLIEGRGVSPDVEVINPPNASFNGQDAQLEAAIGYLEEKIRTQPIPELRSQPLPPLGQTGLDVE
ncbi:MAG: S41 family peptidase [Pseudomonadota bacterium]